VAEKSGFLLLAGLICLAFIASREGLAQGPGRTGSIEGYVVDPKGAAVPQATVVITHQQTGMSRELSTDEAGKFSVSGLPVGGYTITVEKEGFTRAVTEEVTVSLGAVSSVHIELQLAAVASSVQVQEQLGPVDVTATSSSAALGTERIEEAPSQNRNYLAFVLLAPGVAPAAGSKAQRSLAGLRSPSVDSGLVFGGLRPSNNGLWIDGVDNRDETTGGNRAALGLEMVQEFRVTSVPIGAEFGGAAGGLVNMVTRSGTNLWHGDFTFFSQNEALNARDPEVVTGNRPVFRRYQPGMSVLGPLRRDRTFFATAIEHETEKSQEWSGTPEEALPWIQAALSRPEFRRAPVRAVFRGLYPASADETTFAFKLDHQPSVSHLLSARYALSRGRVGGDVYGLDNWADYSARASSLVWDHSFVATWLAVPSPHWVSDFRLQMARREARVLPNIPGPMLQIPGVVNLGQSYNADSWRAEDHWEAVEGLEWVAGQHRLTLGTDVHLIQLRARIADRFNGIYVFPTLEAFLAGRPDVYLQAFGTVPTQFATLPFGTWLQERWQVRRGLTIETGFRFDAQWLPRPFPSPQAHFSPRIGLAWRPGRTGWVFRAGWGIFRDRYPLAYLNSAVQKDGRHAVEQYLTGEAAVEAFARAQAGSLSGPLPAYPLAWYRADKNFPPAYARKMVLGAERALGKDTKLSVEFASVRGFHLPRIRNAHITLPPVYQLEQAARSSHHGLTVSVSRSVHRDFSFLVGYTLGRSQDDASDFEEQPMDPSDVRREWSLSRHHQLHRFVASGLFEVPADEWRGLPTGLRRLFSDVVVSPIVQLSSGRPLNALLTSDVYRTGAYPISARPEGVRRNAFRWPATANLNLRLMKGIWLWERRAILQFGAEAFNLLNHTNPQQVSPYYQADGRYLASFGGLVETLGARQVQLFAQLEY